MRSNRRNITLTVAGLGIASSLLLTGCSADYWPDFSGPKEIAAPVEASPSNLAPVPVSERQIQHIIDGVSEAATTGDEKLDAAALEERFSGDALTQRTANYRIRESVADYGSKPAPITSQMLGYRLVQSTETWPRTLFLTVASEGEPAEDAGEDSGEQTGEATEAPALALVLTQRIPQENFRVSRMISLRGGIEMPKAAPAEEGTALLAADLESLALKPGDVGTAYAAILQGGKDVDEAKAFELAEDPLIDHYGKAWADDAKQKSDAEEKTQKYSVTVEQGEEPIVSLSTGVGGALVATTVIESQVVDSDGGRYKPQAEGAVAALSGLSGQQDRIVRKVSHQLLFFVPSKEDGSKIQLLGVTSELVEAGK